MDNKGESAKVAVAEPARNGLFGLFYLFLFFLPLYEAPKNIFGGLFFLGGCLLLLADRWVGRSKRRARGSHLLGFFLLFASPFLAGVGTEQLDWFTRFRSALNWALLPGTVLIFLVLSSTSGERMWALRSVCLGGIVAVFQAFMLWTGQSYPELNSVGHVNQSALFLAFLSIACGYLCFSRSASYLDVTISATTLGAIILFQGPAKSITAVVVLTIGLIGMGILFVRRIQSRQQLLGIAGLMIAVIGMGVVVLQKNQWQPFVGLIKEIEYRMSSESDPWSQRDRLIASAWRVASDSATGFGLGSFGQVVTNENLRIITLSKGLSWEGERERFFVSSHGHNFFANVLVERGWSGIILIGLALGLIALTIKRKSAWSCEQVLGVSLLVMIFIGGLGQSVLHVEHGQLAFILLGLSVCDA